MLYKDLIAKLQKELNAKGARLTVDGDPGPLTRAALDRVVVEIQLKKLGVSPIPSGKDDYFGAPWVFANIDLLGRYETDPLVIARFEPEWDKERRSKGFRGLAGSERAWCMMGMNADYRKVGIPGTDDPAAATLSGWGFECPEWFGAGMPIKHDGGGRHAARFLYWINKAKGICATIDMNRSNRFGIFETRLATGYDKLVGGFRWPKGYPAGRIVTQAEAIARYPFLRVGSSGGSTR